MEAGTRTKAAPSTIMGITGEMCVVTGTQVRADDPMTPSDFTCVRN